VLIDKTQRIKICDFGFGNVVKERHEVLSTYCGSPFYAAPEMVTATPYRGPPVDLWSCGVILYAMLTGSLPFQGDEMPQLFQKISRGQYTIPPYVTRDASDLIQRLLCKDARDRISAKDCLMHPWLMPPTISRCSVLTTSQLSLSSRLPNFSTRKKVGVFSEESSTTMATLVDLPPHKNIVMVERVPTDKKIPTNNKASQFFLRIFRKKTQVAPAGKLEEHAEDRHDEKKVKPRFIFGSVKRLFRISFQKRITQ
jgi:serine/threonine protein kinase